MSLSVTGFCSFGVTWSSQDFEEARKGVPVTSRDGSAQVFLEFPQEPDSLEVPPIHAERKPALNSNDPDQPVFLSREADREWR